MGRRSGRDDIEPAPAAPLACTRTVADHAGNHPEESRAEEPHPEEPHAEAPHAEAPHAEDPHAEAPHPGLDPVDTARVSAMCETLRTTPTGDLLMEVFSGADGATGLVEAVRNYCTFDHGALLVFPHSFDEALAALRSLGAEPGEVLPSVVVKGRLSRRYRIAPELLDVRLTHAPLPGSAGRTVEVFMLPQSPSVPGALVERERSLDLERHFALRVPRPDPVVIQGLRWLLWEQAGFAWDGGGYNPHDDRAAGGTSVLYFLRSARDATGAVHRRRLEVKFPGDFSHLTRTHVAAGHRPGRHSGRRPLLPLPPPLPAMEQIPAPIPAQATDSA